MNDALAESSEPLFATALAVKLGQGTSTSGISISMSILNSHAGSSSSHPAAALDFFVTVSFALGGCVGGTFLILALPLIIGHGGVGIGTSISSSISNSHDVSSSPHSAALGR